MSKRTLLYETHRALGARVIEFGGWDMPVQYSGILAEHHAVRTKAGLFDLSHMGEVEVSGPHALEALQELVVTDVSRIQLGQAQYSLMCYPDGGIVDDIIIYRLAEDRFFVCVNAANINKDFEWMTQHNRAQATIVDHSEAYALIAVQGPTASAIVQRLTPLNLAQIKRYWFTTGEVAGASAFIARTGYTGEDGFELFVATDQAVKVWNACLDAGRNDGLLPIGLGARDTLRLEAAYMLYGNDIDAQTTPIEAGLHRLVKFEKPSFIGRDALLQQQAAGIRKQFVGLRMDEPGIPRHGYLLWHEEQHVGIITSGTQSPTLGVGIALGYVLPTCATVGTPLTVEIRGRRLGAHVVERPFYRKS